MSIDSSALGKDVIVLDIGGTSIRVGHTRGEELYNNFERISSQQLCVPNAQEKLFSIIDSYAKKHDLELKATVLGIPGMLDRANDSITHCNNIPQLEGVGLKEYLSNTLGCPVLFEQDTMLQLIGEWRAGVGNQEPSLFGVYFGTGIGAAYLLNGNPDNPLVQNIQAGHIPIMAEGRLCMCGNKDCIEAYACGHTLTELASKTDCPVEDLFTHVSTQSSLADELEQFILYQSYMLATISTLFMPGMIIIGGGVPQMAGYPRDQLIDNTIRHLQKPYTTESTQFAWASLGGTAPLHGALALLDIQHHS